MLKSILRLMAIAICAGFAFGAVWLIHNVRNTFTYYSPNSRPAHLAEKTFLPHHVPPRPGGASFRFAMAHDVVHERYPRHGIAYHRERERLSREKLAKLAPNVPYAWAQTDDIAIALANQGRMPEAIAMLREKLARQGADRLPEREKYSSYANLGTILTRAHQAAAMKGDAAARERFREGTDLIRKAIKANPDAHFGREKWQAAYVEFIAVCFDQPKLAQKYDFLGNRLDLFVEHILNREVSPEQYGRTTNLEFSRGHAKYRVAMFFDDPTSHDDPSQWEAVSKIREFITKVGAEGEWQKLPIASHKNQVAFDEPMLGIIGMWRQGEGANPHFALAIAETMLRVGQRYIAWAAYERTSLLVDEFAADAATRTFLKEHCKWRQSEIEGTMRYRSPNEQTRTPWQQVSPPPDAQVVDDLRKSFEHELEYGKTFQRAYQEYEAKKIAAGASIDDDTFYDEFMTGREPIASPIGPEEWFAWVPREKFTDYGNKRGGAWGLLSSGIVAFLVALFFRWRDSWDRRRG